MKKLFTLFVAALFCATMFADNTRTIYFKATQDYWNWLESGASATAIYAWEEGVGEIAPWPGIRMSKVESEANVWKAEIANNFTKVIFIRVNPEGDFTEKDLKTKDLELPTDGKNLYTITLDEMDWEHFNWDDGIQEGEWSAFVPAKFYITGDSALVVDAGFDKSIAWNPAAIKSIEDSYTLTNLKANQTYKLKVTANGTWDTKKQFDNLTDTAGGLFIDSDINICFRLATDGDVTVTYTNSEFTLSGNFAAPTVAIVGNFAGNDDWWVPVAGNTMTPADDKKSASVTFDINEAKHYEMKVWEDGSYLSKNGAGETLYEIHSEHTLVKDVNLYGSGRNFDLNASKSGSYTFTWTFATRTLEVTFPNETAIDEINANDKAIKRVVNGQLLIIRDGKTFNALGIQL